MISLYFFAPLLVIIQLFYVEFKINYFIFLAITLIHIVHLFFYAYTAFHIFYSLSYFFVILLLFFKTKFNYLTKKIEKLKNKLQTDNRKLRKLIHDFNFVHLEMVKMNLLFRDLTGINLIFYIITSIVLTFVITYENDIRLKIVMFSILTFLYFTIILLSSLLAQAISLQVF